MGVHIRVIGGFSSALRRELGNLEGNMEGIYYSYIILFDLAPAKILRQTNKLEDASLHKE